MRCSSSLYDELRGTWHTGTHLDLAARVFGEECNNVVSCHLAVDLVLLHRVGVDQTGRGGLGNREAKEVQNAVNVYI
jgi:hypothetical protein